MRRKITAFCILALITIGFGILLIIPQVDAAATDNYKVRAGDWYIHKIFSIKEDYGMNAGDEIKTNITAVNSSHIPSPSIYADMVFVNVTNRSLATPTWTTLYDESLLAVYNSTDANLMTQSGDAGYVLNGGIAIYYLQVGSMVGCINETALHLYLNNSIPPYLLTNQSSHSGLTYTYWNGSTDGNGLIPGAKKAVIIFESEKIVSSVYQIYNWTGTTWDLTLDTKLTSYSWYVPQPPIPGFEFVIIGIALISLVGLYFWKKDQIQIT